MTKRDELTGLAREIDEHLRVIRKAMQQPVEAEIARGGLTGPQRAVMQALVRTEGLSLKALSEAVGLAHSTVSGIVDRLSKQGLVERRPDAADGRVSLIGVTAQVNAYLRETLPALLTHPLADALGSAKPAERQEILTGLRTLRRVLEGSRPAAS